VAISSKSIKLLWSNAAGRCSFTGCNERLTVEQAAEFAPYTIGEMAHIKGNKAGSNRYDESQPDTERDSYENLILLCPNHHTRIDMAPALRLTARRHTAAELVLSGDILTIAR